jgi:hypothetical protein
MALYGDDYCSVDPHGWDTDMEFPESFDPDAWEEAFGRKGTCVSLKVTECSLFP